MTEVEKINEDDILISSETRLKKISAKLKWTITDFQALSDNRRRFPILNSSVFFLKDNECENSFRISCLYDYKYLQLKCSPELPKHAKVVCSINNNGKILWQSQSFIPPLHRASLTAEFLLQNKKLYLSDNTLKLLFRIEIVEDLVTELVTDLCQPFDFTTFQRFFNEEIIFDVTFLIENEKLKAHKIILAARSPVFLAMFCHEFSEQKNSMVMITDIRPEIFKALLQYVYNAEIENIKEIAEELLIAADKYLIKELKLKCEKILISDMLQEKAAILLPIAIQYKCENLEACCRYYLSEKQKVEEH